MAAALFLSRRGHRCVVYEAAAKPGPSGPPVLLSPAALAVLDALGLGGPALAHGAPVGRILAYAGGRRVLDLSYAEAAPGTAALGLHRGTLFRLLFEALEAEPGATVVPGMAVAGAEPAGDGVAVVDGVGARHGPFALVVGADGAGSGLRAGAPAAAGRAGVLWGVAPDPTGVFAGAVRRVWDGRDRAQVVPVGRLPDEPGGPPLVAVTWPLAAGRREAWRRDGVAAWRARATALWPALGPVVAHFQAEDDLVFAPHPDAPPAEAAAPATALVGDAAAAGPPHLLSGAAEALLDAEALAAAVEGARDVEEALAVYRGLRAPDRARRAALDRRAAAMLDGDAPWTGALRDAALAAAGRVPRLRRAMLRALGA
jgi:2-polyprenyl-6-methoxyphenol hydroxylase-like FAD-dependent oxidoreductase